MSFTEILSLELLVELSEEQQEFVAGGVSSQIENSYSSEIEYSEGTAPEYSSEESTEETIEDKPFFKPIFFWSPLLGVNSLHRIAPTRLLI